MQFIILIKRGKSFFLQKKWFDIHIKALEKNKTQINF